MSFNDEPYQIQTDNDGDSKSFHSLGPRHIY